MKRLILSYGLIFFLSVGTGNANPLVSGISGNVTDNFSFTISGVDFSQRASTPVKWDNFEHGVANSDLNGWTLYRDNDSAGQVNPRYSNARSRSGQLSGMASFLGAQYNCSAYISGLNLNEIYVSYWLFVEKVSGAESRNVKQTRVVAGVPTFNSGTPSLGSTTFYNINQNWYSFNGTNAGDEIWGGLISEGTWHRVELYGKISSIGVNNGARGYWMDLNQVNYSSSYITYTSSSNTSSYKNVLLPFYVAHDPGGDYRIYYDNVYVDSSRARVEIGNAATWEACTLREVQIPTSWSATSVDLMANTSSFQVGHAWLYLVDNSGNVSPGYPVTIGPPASGPPLTPAGFGLQ